ncbi:MAG: hypothetical protein ACLQBJ_05065 [Bryobacteraceae bacterium]
MSIFPSARRQIAGILQRLGLQEEGHGNGDGDDRKKHQDDAAAEKEAGHKED